MLKHIITIVLTFSVALSYGQIAKSGMYASAQIPSNGFMSVFGSHDFTDMGKGNSIVMTERGSDRSYMIFADGASWGEASVNGYVDGFAKSFSKEDYVLPIGNNEDYRPIVVSGGSNAAASYFAEDPGVITSTLSNDVEQLSGHGYYEIEGIKPTKFSLTWNHFTGIDRLVDDIGQLGIVGFDGEQWVAIPSQIEENQLSVINSSPTYVTQKANVDEGIISTLTEIDLSQYEYVSLARMAPNAIAESPMSLSVYPNPAVQNNFIYLDYAVSDTDTEILISHIGEAPAIVHQVTKTGRTKAKIDTDGLRPGVYWVSVKSNAGEKVLKKLIILDATAAR
jgi:hypothetical protein